jgi:hypothetical protein
MHNQTLKPRVFSKPVSVKRQIMKLYNRISCVVCAGFQILIGNHFQITPDYLVLRNLGLFPSLTSTSEHEKIFDLILDSAHVSLSHEEILMLYLLLCVVVSHIAWYSWVFWNFTRICYRNLENRWNSSYDYSCFLSPFTRIKACLSPLCGISSLFDSSKCRHLFISPGLTWNLLESLLLDVKSLDDEWRHMRGNVLNITLSRANVKWGRKCRVETARRVDPCKLFQSWRASMLLNSNSKISVTSSYAIYLLNNSFWTKIFWKRNKDSKEPSQNWSLSKS